MTPGVAWRLCARSPLATRGAPSLLPFGSDLLVIGGWELDGPRLDGAIYDRSTDRWRRTPAAPSGLSAFGARWLKHGDDVVGCALSDDQLSIIRLAVDGAWALEPTSIPWSPEDGTPVAVAVDGELALLTFGGVTSDSAVWWNSSGEWKKHVTSADLDRREAAVAAVGSLLFVWDGVDLDGRPLASGVVIDTRDATLRTLPESLLRGAPDAQAHVVANEIVVWGGSAPSGTTINQAAAFSTVTAEWRELSRPPFRVLDSSSVADGDHIVVFGPSGARKGSTVLVLDTRADQWFIVEQSGFHPGSGTAGCALSGDLFVWSATATQTDLACLPRAALASARPSPVTPLPTTALHRPDSSFDLRALADQILERAAGFVLVASQPDDPERAAEALSDALADIRRIPNPIEPGDPLPSAIAMVGPAARGGPSGGRLLA